jgi:hypothetical protein
MTSTFDWTWRSNSRSTASRSARIGSSAFRSQDGHGVGVRLARVDDDRPLELPRHGDLLREDGPLHVRR